MKKRSGAITGVILGVAAIFGAFILEGGSVKALFLISPLIIVFGGTFSAVLIGFGVEKFQNIPRLMKKAYFPQEYNLTELINILVEFSIISRKEGLLSLEKELNKVSYYFPKKLIKYAIDGTESDEMQNLAILEMKGMQERHFQNIGMFSKMGGYAPTMGIIGTVMGLIMTLAGAGGDPTSLIHNIATAFIATLWGVFSANIIWLPVGDKLKECHLQEKNMMEVSLEGVMALQSGEIPSVVKARLISMLPQREQLEIYTI